MRWKKVKFQKTNMKNLKVCGLWVRRRFSAVIRTKVFEALSAEYNTPNVAI